MKRAAEHSSAPVYLMKEEEKGVFCMLHVVYLQLQGVGGRGLELKFFPCMYGCMGMKYIGTWSLTYETIFCFFVCARTVCPL